MSLIGINDINQLPSVWAEARSTSTLHNERTNIPQIITRTEADAIVHNSAGPIHRTTHEAPLTTWQDIHQSLPNNERQPELARQQYSAIAQNQSNYHPHDNLPNNYNNLADNYNNLSRDYNHGGQNLYNPNPNPVIINRVV